MSIIYFIFLNLPVIENEGNYDSLSFGILASPFFGHPDVG